MFRNRSVVELMVIAITFTVVVAVLCGGATLAIMEYRDPTLDNSKTEEHLFNLVSTMLGALLGLLTGAALARRRNEPDDSDDPPDPVH